MLEPFLGRSRFANHGQRVVEGQRLMQSASDILLGWIRATGHDGVSRDFYVRQLWDGKGSAVIEAMEPASAGGVRRALRLDARPGARPLRRRRRHRGLPRLGRDASTARSPSSPRATPTRTSATTPRCSEAVDSGSCRPRWGCDRAEVPGRRAVELARWDRRRQRSIDFVTSRHCGAGGVARRAAGGTGAVFDNDGTLWYEKRMPIQLDFMLRRLAEMVRGTNRSCVSASRGRPLSEQRRGLARYDVHDQALRRRRHRRAQPRCWGSSRRYAEIAVENFEQAVRTPSCAARSTPRSGAATCRLRVRADGRAARLPRCARLHATTSSRAAAATSCGRSAGSMYGMPRERVIGSSTDAGLRQRRTRRHGSPTSLRPTTSTTGRRSRYISGSASADARCSRRATRTAT